MLFIVLNFKVALIEFFKLSYLMSNIRTNLDYLFLDNFLKLYCVNIYYLMKVNNKINFYQSSSILTNCT